MSLSLSDIDWRVAVPDVPAELPVATVATPSYEERLHAVRTLHERFTLGATVEIDLPEGVAHASDRGEVQFFAASGAVRARDARVCRAFPDQRRLWDDVEEVIDGTERRFVLGEHTSAMLFQDAGELLRAARLLPDGLGDVDVVLDEWIKLDESGAELDRGPGRAVVRAPYSVDGVPFIGAGAKTRLAYEPVGGRLALARIFHVHRPVVEVALVRTGGTERALTGLLRDPVLAGHQQAGGRVAVTRIQVGLLALPAVVAQRLVAPAVAVAGVLQGAGDDAEVPFARYYQAVSAAALRRVGLAAAHLPH
ncbi:hypothetical protein [Actinophytocola sp.]|uniref:hypothetical protein n=1 Tax=Actinophytocola sp. TaxID=1872138 RepID=UPI002D8013B2|nr:hypothetical protein [Actinophytocola sp.]HET9140924.1 hypothetical protein [Actinophytocola sp.]